MRPYLSLLPMLSLCTLLLLISACHKSNDHRDDHNLIGSWKLVLSSGGIAGRTEYPSPDSTYVLTLNSDSSFLRGFTNHPRVAGVFTTAWLARHFGGGQLAPAILLITPSGTHYPLFYTVKKDSLWLSDDFADGYNSLYLRTTTHASDGQ